MEGERTQATDQNEKKKKSRKQVNKPVSGACSSLPPHNNFRALAGLDCDTIISDEEVIQVIEINSDYCISE